MNYRTFAAPILSLALAVQAHAQFSDAVSTEFLQQSATEQQIRDRLNQVRDLSFQRTELSSVAEFFRANGVPVRFDVSSLDDYGIALDTPITFQESGIRLRDGLTLLLQPLDLVWTIDHGRVIVSAEDYLDSRLLTKVYDVRHLVDLVPMPQYDGFGTPLAGATYQYDFDSLLDVIMSSIEPESWDEVGGYAAIRPYWTRRMRVIVVSQSYPAHEKIEELLFKLGKVGGFKPLPDSLPFGRSPGFFSVESLTTVASPPQSTLRSSKLRSSNSLATP